MRGLEKSFKDLHVLRGVDFDVAPSSIFALLGSNGAGKTTIVRILATLLRADAGSASVNGLDVAGQPADVASRSASPASSRPSTRSSPVARTSYWSPGCGTSTDPGAIADDLLDRFSLTDAADRRRRPTPGACAAGSTSR